MGRFILRYEGSGPKPDEDVARVRDLRDTTVLDDSPRMLLVEAPEEVLRAHFDGKTDWVVSREQSYELPPRHPSLGKAGKGLKQPE